MKTYVVTAPNGKEYEIDAPDGATQEQALAHFQENWQSQQPAAPVEKPDPSEGGSTLQIVGGLDTGIPISEGVNRTLAGAGAGIKDIGLRLQQLLGQNVDQQVDEKRSIDAPLMDTAGGSLGRGIAYAAPTMLAPFTMGGALASGAVMGGLEPTGAGEGLGTDALNIGGGAAANFAGFGAGKLLSKAIAPLGRTSRDALGNLINTSTQSAPYKAAVELLKSKGIPMDASKITNNESLKNLWRALGQNPITAGFVQADRDAAAKAANREVSGWMGRQADYMTPDSLMANLSEEGGKIGSITDSIDNVPLNKQFIDELTGVEADYQSVLESLRKGDYGALRDDLLNKVMQQNLTGKQAQATQRVIREGTPTEGLATEPMRNLRKVLNNAVDRAANNPELAKARTNYALLRKILPSGKGVAAVSNEGNVIPSRLANAFKGERGDKAQFARALQMVMPEIGSSNTAGQQLWNQILQGGIANPALTGLIGAGVGAGTSGFDPTATAKGLAIGLTPKLAYKALSTPYGSAYLQGSLREAIPSPVDALLKKLFVGAPTALLAGNKQ
jgi:hypothetical protein